jgi:hypothetical protein
MRPVLLQHRPAERIDFHLPLARHAGPLQPEIEAADTSEETPEGHSVNASSTERTVTSSPAGTRDTVDATAP